MLGLSRGFLRKVLGFMMSFSTLPALTNSCIPLEDGWPTVPQEETKAQKCTQGGKLQDSESNGTNSRLKETGTNSEELCVYNLYIKCSMCLNVNHKDQPFECSYQKKTFVPWILWGSKLYIFGNLRIGRNFFKQLGNLEKVGVIVAVILVDPLLPWRMVQPLVPSSWGTEIKMKDVA